MAGKDEAQLLQEAQPAFFYVVVERVRLSVTRPSDPHDGLGAEVVEGEEVAADAKRAVGLGCHRLVEEDDPDLVIEPVVVPTEPETDDGGVPEGRPNGVHRCGQGDLHGTTYQRRSATARMCST